MVAQYINLLTANSVEASVIPHIVGRQRELASLWTQYKTARSGYTRVVLLTGEPGIGKTCLLDEFATQAVEDGATVLRGGASESEGMPPYLPFLEALGQHIRTAPLDKLLEQTATAPQILTSILPELAHRLGEIPVAYPLPAEQTRLRLYEAIGMFLEAISMSQVLVLSLDDLHWADSSSLDLLCYIARHHPRSNLLIVGTYREGEADRNLALSRATIELARQRILTKIAVEPLSAQESEALAASYLGNSISPTVSQLLYTQSEGNPFFVEELLQGWIERGALLQKHNQWIAVASLEHSLPASIVGALRQRFAQLPSTVIDHLRIAAIIGQTFDISLLASVESQEVETVEERLLEAERARLVKAEHAGTFKFSHGKIRQCLYTEVSTSRRQRLHEAIGRTLEARYEKGYTKSSFQLAELAFHFTHSGDTVRGVTYSQLAAEQAMRSSASKEAMAHYQTALELLEPGDSRRGTILLGLGKAALLANMASEAASAYKDALTWLLQTGNHSLAAQAAHKFGLAQWRQGALQEAKSAFEHTLTLLGNTLNAEKVKVLIDVSTLTTLNIGQQPEGLAYAQQAVEMARLLEDKSLVVAANQIMAMNSCISNNDLSTAMQLLEQTLSLAEASDDFCQATECSLYLMFVYFCTGQITRSHVVNLRSVEFIKQSQQPSRLPYTYCWRALLFASQGNWANAESMLDQALNFTDNQASCIFLTLLHQIRGFLAFQQEVYDVAEQAFLAVTENPYESLSGLLYYAHMLGMTQIALGKREEAYVSLIKLETYVATLPTGSLLTAPLLTFMALMAIALDDQERIEKLYPRLLPFSGQYYGFLVDRVLGEMAIFCQNWEVANHHLSSAEETARREELRPELARISVRQTYLETIYDTQGSKVRARNLLNHSLVLSDGKNTIDAKKHANGQRQPLENTTTRALPADLTTREARVLQLVVEGMSNRQIAQELGISEKTVANHLSHIFNKTTSENRAAATAFAIRHGIA